MEEANNKPKIYVHSKTGNRYVKLCESKSSENPDDVVVVYQALYGDRHIWHRPKSMFYENVDINGVMVPRFREELPNE